MKKYLLSFIMTLSVACVFGQCYPTYFLSDKAANTTDVIKQNHVKTEYVYGYIFTNNIFKHSVIKDSVLRYTCTYNTDGNPLMRRVFNRGNVYMKDSSIYDPSGQTVKTFQYSVLKTGDRLDYVYTIVYDKSGNKMSIQGSFTMKDSVHNYITRYTYNARNQLTSEIYAERDTVESTTTYTYNEEGDLIRKENAKPNGITQYGALYEYNRRKDKITVYTLGKKQVSHELEYNKYGQCTLLSSVFLHPSTISLFDYREDGLFSGMKKVQLTLIKELSRHYYTRY
ncbi:MAG: hypothetical protein V4539_24830 [Bacteroidota bacterium]